MQAWDLRSQPTNTTPIVCTTRQDFPFEKPGPAPPTFIDLSALHYMRDLLIDQKGDLWIGGWNQRVQLCRQGNQWSQDHYRLTHSVLISP
ncbi:hypothetical protein ACSYAD_17460 [Acaryochloris marina NIES-2412]|uniref:hypothetical protein n=1 Tax=Acaryochloris marina TaxID=155978 RepID=UPI0040599045